MKEIGWRIIECENRQRFESDLNILAEKYEFIELHFSTTIYMKEVLYTALVLIGEKNNG